jgi:hypothetical protein
LVPISFLPAVVALASIVLDQLPQFGDPETQFSITFNSLAIVVLLGFVVASAVAGTSAFRGRPVPALTGLGVVALFWLPVAFWPGNLRIPTYELLALPGAVAFVVALLGLPQLIGRADRRTAVPVLILLALPLLTFGAIRGYFAVYYANDCPSGAEINLTVSGLESAHFNQACDLPRYGTELTGCRQGDATTGLLTWEGPWFLELMASSRGTVTSASPTSAAPNLLVAGNTSYGGPYGWRGFYTVEGVCHGSIDADLFSALVAGQKNVGPGPPVHVEGTWDAPVIS